MRYKLRAGNTSISRYVCTPGAGAGLRYSRLVPDPQPVNAITISKHLKRACVCATANSLQLAMRL